MANTLEFNRGDSIASKYEVIDRLEESPLGITYRVKHLKSGRFVRLVLLRPKFAGREQKHHIIQAFKQAKELQHSNLMKLGELGEHEGIAYFTMEDFEGSTLRELITQNKVEGRRFELHEAAQITNQILESLDALHQAGTILRSLRPEYVLVTVRRTGPRKQNFVARVKLTGTAFWDLVPAGVLAEDEFTRGEAQYLAPELRSFEPTPTARTDVYSAGVMFYEMLTGSAPVGTFQLPGSLRPDLPNQVNDVVELALANAPDDRYQTARDFQLDIQRTLQDSSIGDGERRPLMTPLGWGVGALLVVAVGIILWQTRPDPEAEQRALAAADAELRAEVRERLVLPAAEEVQGILENHPPNMAYVPGGPFIAGRLHLDPHAQSSEPLAQVMEVEPFLIDMFNYPNYPNEDPQHSVDFNEANRLCKEAGKRLCSATEWEMACKGPFNSIYAYESGGPVVDFDPDVCGDGLRDRGYPSGTREQCRSGWGVFDMSGGFREWTSTAPSADPNRRIVKGGHLQSAARGTRCAYSFDAPTPLRDSTMSFRCCRDVDAPPVFAADAEEQ